MIKPDDPKQLAIDLLARSICAVQVAAVIADNHGIFSWGWNSVGSGLGEHAEAAAIRRANKNRLEWATIYVASQRKRKTWDKPINSKPCSSCERLLKSHGIRRIYFRRADGIWDTKVLL